MTDDDLQIEIRIRFDGRDLRLGRMMTRTDLEQIMPPRSLPEPTPELMADWSQRSERRKHLVAAISSSLAHELIEGLYRLRKRP